MRRHLKHTVDFVDSCRLWAAVDLTPGATYGPRCLVFQAAADRPAGLMLVWTPNPIFGGDHPIKLS